MESFIVEYYTHFYPKLVHIIRYIDRGIIYSRINELLKYYITPWIYKKFPCGNESVDDELFGCIKLLAISSNGIKTIYEIKDEVFVNEINEFLSYARTHMIKIKDLSKIILDYIEINEYI